MRGAAYDGAGPAVLTVTAGDDHGLAAVRLHVFRRGAGGGERAAAAPVTLFALGGAPASSAPAWSGAATVDPARLGVAPGEVVVVRIEAVDASPWAQRGWSAPLTLAAPTREAMRGAARATADSALAGVAAALTAARDLQQRTADAARSRALATPTAAASGGSSASSPASYAAAERARALAAQQRQLQADVAAARAQTEALQRRLERAGALDPALARQLAEAQRMLRDALTPELEAKLATLGQQGGAGASGAQTRQTLEELAEAQRELRERLERTADVLRRAALEGAMQTLGDEAREVAAAEARAVPRAGAPRAGAPREGSPRDPAHSASAGEAARTAARAAAVRDAIDSLRARLGREQASAGANGAAQANAHAARSAQAMQRAASQAAQAAQSAQGAPSEQGASSAGASAQGSAENAAAEMRQAADALAKGRSAQIDAWKATLGAELDRAASETAQLAREQAAVRETARGGADAAGARGAEGAIRDGVEQTARRLAQAGRTSALLSERTRRAVDEARQQVAAAARALERGGTPGGQSDGQAGAQPGGAQSGAQAGALNARARGAGQGGPPPGRAGADAAMADAQEALSRASNALVRDRARVRDASSAAGAEEVLAQFRAAAGQQARLNEQSLTLPQKGQGSGQGQGNGQAPGKDGRAERPGGTQPGGGREGGGEAARRLAAEQRAIADRLEGMADGDGSGRGEELAREARALAATLDRQASSGTPNDPVTLARQQQLYRKLLEAGQSLERDEQDDKGPRESRAGVAVGDGAPATGATSGRSATRVAPPTWNELRALSPDERRLVLEYFRRLNAAP